MEPRIQYAQTADGVSIAFWTLGEGMPFVHMPFLFSHTQLEWQIPELRRWYEQLADKRKLVRYDGRGSGLSERDIADYSLDARVMDLEAVVDRLGLEWFALWGLSHSGPGAIAYAARHPERVSGLILWGTYARASDWSRSPQVQAVRALMDKDWETYTETAAHTVLGWSAGEPARRYAALIRESITQEALAATTRASNEFDVTALLAQVRSPTLVLHPRPVPVLDVNVARGLASQIPDARLVLLERESATPYLGDTDALLAAIDEFLGEGEEAAAAAEPPAGAFRTVLFTDVEGSTMLTQRLGDAKAREVLRAHERIVREALKAHGGSEVKTMGDGFMASFSSATRALECAIAMQRAFAEHNESAEEPIRVRIGLNAGEPIAEEEDLFGTAVILAARIAAKAEGGEIVASDVVRQLVAGKGFLFSDRGDVALRGFEDPVRLYDVGWRD
ncbi:MAG: adenylate/guanylate cyclase domain-containing protein [Dehalococcoidia bacterium]|nr:MAG: adenylate/guanylate cyclase domain-containing protein [Dehalococcoidia bacterium]